MKTLIIDTVDFTSFFPEAGYEVGYLSIDGGQGGNAMLDGTQSVDELTTKAVVSLPLLPLTESQLQSLLDVLMPTAIHTVQYYDPWRGIRTATMKRSTPKFKHRGYGSNREEYWTKGEIELTEK